jgi:hypothetical protein
MYFVSSCFILAIEIDFAFQNEFKVLLWLRCGEADQE